MSIAVSSTEAESTLARLGGPARSDDLTPEEEVATAIAFSRASLEIRQDGESGRFATTADRVAYLMWAVRSALGDIRAAKANAPEICP